MLSPIVEFLPEFGTQGAVFTAASILLFGGAITWWWWFGRRTVTAMRAVQVRILVTGSRGKSSVVRLLHAALREGGYAPYAKTTGTAAREIDVEGREHETRRIGQVSVIEMLETARRAVLPGDHRPRPGALVEECMGVRPGNIRLTAERMALPTIVVILNALHDHPEDEGETPEAVAETLWNAVGPETELVVTGERAPGPSARLRYLADLAGTPLEAVDPDTVPAAALESAPDAHPVNLAVALAITRHLGIPDAVAIRGFGQATHEPSDRVVLEFRDKDVSVVYIDLGSINDVDSLAASLRIVDEQRRPGYAVMAILTNRWQRPFRILQFAAFLRPDMWDGVVLVGDGIFPARMQLLRGGFPLRRTLSISAWQLIGDIWAYRMRAFIRRLAADGEGVVVVRGENIHEPVAERLRRQAERLRDET